MKKGNIYDIIDCIIHTPSEMFLFKGRLNNHNNDKRVKQIKSVTHVGK